MISRLVSSPYIIRSLEMDIKVEELIEVASEVERMIVDVNIQEERNRNMATGIPNGELRDSLLAKADMQYYKGRAYNDTLVEIRRILPTASRRDWRIRKRNKSITLRINTEDLDRIEAGFKSVIHHTYNGLYPYNFIVKRNGDISFRFDNNRLRLPMNNRSELVVKFKYLSCELVWTSLERMLNYLNGDNSWYNGQVLQYLTVYYVT